MMRRSQRKIEASNSHHIHPTFNSDIFSNEGSSDEDSVKISQQSSTRSACSNNKLDPDKAKNREGKSKSCEQSKRHEGRSLSSRADAGKTSKENNNGHKRTSELRRSNRNRNEAECFFRGQDEFEEIKHHSQTKPAKRRISAEDSYSEENTSSSESASSIFSDEGGKKSKTRIAHRKSKAMNSKKSTGNSKRKVLRLSSSEEEEEDEDSESESGSESDWMSSSAEERTPASSAKKRKQRSSRRQVTQLKLSYKEESDNGTNSEDLIEMSEEEEAEDVASSETIEKVMKSRKGRKGATGIKTTIYNEENCSDPSVDPNTHQDELEQQYLIKWKNSSHLHNTWESDETLRALKVNGLKKLENFKKREVERNLWRATASPEEIEYNDCQNEVTEELYVQYCEAERIVTHYPQKTDAENFDYLVKWSGLPYSECTREDCQLIKNRFPAIVEDYNQRLKSTTIPNKHCRALRHRPKFHNLRSQPDYIGGVKKLQLRDYQLEGLNWLLHSWCKENGAILADEMGLGKTVQTISFLSVLMNEHQIYGPFLMVVPLSTIVTWQREFQSWAPQINVTLYIGDISTRGMIRDYEWYREGSRQLKCNVVLTTYEILLKDKSYLANVNWAVLGVDEAHRLKNDDSMLYKSLIDFQTNHRLFITGTPLQNSLRELWALLHFINPKKFDSWEDFELKHGTSDKTGFQHLHNELRPYLLRRVKKDVEKSLPAKVEQILRIEMSKNQKQYYRWILTRNYKALAKGTKGSVSGFVNVMMELKKCCNHVSLVRPQEEEDKSSTEEILEMLVKGSGKLLLLDKLLPRLKESGHRVLIFAQMVRMLDLIAEYLKLKGFCFQRLDGTINSERRKQAMDHFNADGSQDFCFLLSTRAGGLGVNLVTADTVIIFDSDWNPQNDLQAMARAHRIGQKNQVSVYRLVTKNSVEEEIIERTKKKIVLDHLVIQRMDTSGRTVLDEKSVGKPFSKEELNSILKFGAEELFKECDDEDGDTQVDIDDILSLAETRNTEELRHNAANELLSNFKILSFENLEEDAFDTERTKRESAKSWDEIIPESERQKFEEEESEPQSAEINLPPRSCRTLKEPVLDSDLDSRKRKRKRRGKFDEDDENEDDEDEDDEDEEAEESDDEKQTRRRARPKESAMGFTDAELRRFIKSIKKFAYPQKRIGDVAEDAQLQEKSEADLQNLANVILTTCRQLVKDCEDKPNENNLSVDEGKKAQVRPTFKLGNVTVNARLIIEVQEELEPLATVMAPDTEKKFQLKDCVKRARFDCYWTPEDDVNLLKGVYTYGMGNWEEIKMDRDLGLCDKILPDLGLKPQAKHLQTRTEYLLRALKERLTGRMDDKTKGSVKRKRKHTGGYESSGSDDSSKKEHRAKKRSDKDKKENHTDKKAKKDSSKAKSGRVPVHITIKGTVVADENCGSELSPEIFTECKEKMKVVRKSLKQLSILESAKLKNHTQLMDVILTIGNHISEILSEYNDPEKIKECRSNLWTFVAKFSKHDAVRLNKLYKNATRKQQDEEERKLLEKERQCDSTLHYGNHPLSAKSSWPSLTRLASDRTEAALKRPRRDRYPETSFKRPKVDAEKLHEMNRDSTVQSAADSTSQVNDVQQTNRDADSTFAESHFRKYKRELTISPPHSTVTPLPPPPRISNPHYYNSNMDVQQYHQPWFAEKPEDRYDDNSYQFNHDQSRRSYKSNNYSNSSTTKQCKRNQHDSRFSGLPHQSTSQNWSSSSHSYRPHLSHHHRHHQSLNKDSRNFEWKRFPQENRNARSYISTNSADVTPVSAVYSQQPPAIPVSSQFAVMSDPSPCFVPGQTTTTCSTTSEGQPQPRE